MNPPHTRHAGWKTFSASFTCQDIRNIILQIINNTILIPLMIGSVNLFAKFFINAWKWQCLGTINNYFKNLKLLSRKVSFLGICVKNILTFEEKKNLRKKNAAIGLITQQLSYNFVLTHVDFSIF